MHKRIFTKTTFRHEEHISALIAEAALRAGLSKNEWIVAALLRGIQQEQQMLQQQEQFRLMQQEVRSIKSRADHTLELLLTFIRMFFGMLPEVDVQTQTRLNELGKTRTNYLLEDVAQRIAGGKRSFTGDLEQLVFKKQDWEQTPAAPSAASGAPLKTSASPSAASAKKVP